MKLENKKQIVADLAERFSRSKVVIVADYKGLNVSSINELRRKLREADVEFKVVKNSLLIRASEDTDVALIKDIFTGPNAVAISYDDPVAPAKVLSGFAKDNKKLELRVGVMAGKVLSAEDIKSLAELPSREVLLSKVLSAMIGVPAGFVRTLNAVPVGLLNVLEAIRQQKEAA